MSAQLEQAYGRQNLDYVEEVFEQFLEDPYSVSEEWRGYFQNMEGYQAPPSGTPAVEDAGTTGTYDDHSHADQHPIIHRVGEHKPRVLEGGKEIPPRVLAFIKKVPMFQGIPEPDMRLLASITSEVTIPAGQYICRSGQVDNDLYLIEDGHVSIQRNGTEITELLNGELIGELAVFDERPRSADIITKRDSRMLRVTRADMLRLVHSDSQLASGLIIALSQRLRDAGSRQERVDKLVRAYRERGHVAADLDPLGIKRGVHPELDLEYYGFSEEDLNTKFTVQLGRETSGRSLGDILRNLKKIYCEHIGVQYMHIDNIATQNWIRERLENTGGRYQMPREDQLDILRKLTDAEVFENFLARKFVGAKRFSLEGSESLIPLLDYAVEQAGEHKIDEVVIGMAHRGRLNVLHNIMGKPAAQIFREFQDVDVDAENNRGKGDVKYHLGYGANRTTASGHQVHLSLCFNPSHLEFVGAVAQGRVRAKQDRFGDKARARALPLLIHGDAAFIGQGVTQEMLNMSGLEGYTVGGTVHVILNNQIGFTTDPEDSRSSRYCADIGRMLQIPIFHVNGEHPEAVCSVIRMAMDFRERFKKDVVIDMYSYRKHGHNEGDEPAFTQPELYKAIKRRKTVRQAFVENILALGGLDKSDADRIAGESKDRLEKELSQTKEEHFVYQSEGQGRGLWSAYTGGLDKDVPAADTSFPLDRLRELLHMINTVPEDFTPHNKIKRFITQQKDMADGKTPLNWGVGEALAFASLLDKGTPIRIAGQDAQRGTFAHRHAVLHDNKTGALHMPLQHLHADQGRIEIFNSPLTETSVLGYEYGYSLDTPEGLVIWEAQFGDFCNVAQVIIDQFITSSEDKWQRLSGLVMLLPHGFEGQGPEHSSARLERFLMLAAEDNMQVVNLTTPAQLFHCMRRQVLRKIRKPLVVMSPKSLLRHPRAVSSMSDLAEGQFQKVIPDHADLDKSKVKRVLLCSGKVYYELLEKRENEGIEDVAIVRLEQYYPLPLEELATTFKAYPKDTPAVWVQEEPLNMGAWSFLKLHLEGHIEGNGKHPVSRVGRPESASPATGSANSHRKEQEKLLTKAFDLSIPGWPRRHRLQWHDDE